MSLGADSDTDISIFSSLDHVYIIMGIFPGAGTRCAGLFARILGRAGVRIGVLVIGLSGLRVREVCRGVLHGVTALLLAAVVVSVMAAGVAAEVPCLFVNNVLRQPFLSSKPICVYINRYNIVLFKYIGITVL